METVSTYLPLAYLFLFGILITVAVSLLFYVKQSKSPQTDGVKTWINDSNYNIAASDEELKAIEKAKPEEARQILENIKNTSDGPVSDEVFDALRKKI